MHIIHLFYSRGFDSECGFMWRFWKNRISHDPLPKWHSDERQLSGVSRKTLFRSCVWSWENKESVYVLCAPHFRVCVCVCMMTYSEHCEVFQPTLRRLWLDRRGSVWPAKTHSGHTNSELCMVWEERERWKVRYERNRSRVEERGRQDEREGGGWRELIMFTKCAPTHTHTHTPQLSNDRVTDVVLVSIGRYPVLKNPFRLVKPLTHKS